MKRVNRRSFLKTSAAGAAVVATTPLFSSQVDTSGEDYKAIICILLDGGADSFNMVVPKHDVDAYEKYKQARGDMALEKDKLRPLVKSEYGFHPNMKKMQRMFDSNSLAVIANVGPLVRPISRDEIASAKKGQGIVDLPHGLFSHEKQLDTWMSAGNDNFGWASRVAEELNQDMVNVSVGGANLMQKGGKQNTFVAFGSGDEIKSLDEQLEMVISFLKRRKDKNSPNRQIFFVKSSGWDTHEETICDSKDIQSGGGKIKSFDNSIGTFAQELQRLGLQEKVTTFTMSDFGRTISSNNRGADHGWGGHSFAFGGKIKSGIYGKMPSIEKNSPDALANSAVVPTTSVEQYMATLVDWLGDGKVDLHKVFPSLKAFNKETLGFIS
jgi:uncharacterized protein (DUF1501 family)